MHLVDRGVIGLDDPISDHLPFEVHNPLGDRDVTVHDLLTHRSGLSGGGAKGVWDKPVPLEEALRASYDSDTSPLFGGTTPFWIGKVGEQYNYSNPGIATLGLIVQTANPDGLSFSDYAQRYIMDPLGMESSQYPPAQHEDYVRPDIRENMSTGLCAHGRRRGSRACRLYFSHYPAGGVLAKPADHIRLLTAMMNGGEYDGYRVLEPETVNEMLTPQYEDADSPRGSSGGLVWRAQRLRHPANVVRSRGRSHVRLEDGRIRLARARTSRSWWPTNQWSLPDPSPDGRHDSHLCRGVGIQRASGRRVHARVRRMGVEGVLRPGYHAYAAMFRMYVGVEGDFPADALEEAIVSTRVRPGEQGTIGIRTGSGRA